MNNGKEKCENLKKIRQDIADRYGIDYNPSECHHDGDCHGTCPKCDLEVQQLQDELDEMQIVSLEKIFDENDNSISLPEVIVIDENSELQGDVGTTMGILPPDEENELSSSLFEDDNLFSDLIGNGDFDIYETPDSGEIKK